MSCLYQAFDIWLVPACLRHPTLRQECLDQLLSCAQRLGALADVRPRNEARGKLTIFLIHLKWKSSVVDQRRIKSRIDGHSLTLRIAAPCR